MQVYEVGGCVRDRLLGRETKDRDWVVVGATHDDMTARGFRRVGKDFPVYLHPETNEEYALARTERKSGRGYYGFTVDASPSVTLEEDLARRDLTINAMAADRNGTVIDPYGGRADLEARVLRHVSPAFVEDPLRVLRVARFAARFDFEIAPETMALMREISDAGELETLAPERILSELDRALGETHPDRFVRTLRACGALAALLPEVDRLFGVPQPERYHPEIDTGEHVCLALRQAARRGAKAAVRFAVLVHDVGKGTTPPKDLPSHPAHETRGVPIVEALCDRLRVPKEHRDVAVLSTRHHLRVHRAREMRPAKLLDLLLALDAVRRPERFEDVLLACEIDAAGRTGLAGAPYPVADYLRRARDAIARIDTRPLVERGLSGETFRNALDALRVAALRELRDPRA